MTLSECCMQIQPLDETAMQAAQQHWNQLAKPLHSLGRLEDMIVQLAGIHRSAQLEQRKKVVLIFCADNGIVEEGVTQTGQEVTATVAENFTKGIATVNSLAQVCQADVMPIDIGIARDMTCKDIANRKIAYGTKNFAKEPAMTRTEAEQAILTGIQLVREKKEQGYNLIITGEMGIGNTTTSSAVFSVLSQIAPELVTGKGAGLSKAGIQTKNTGDSSCNSKVSTRSGRCNRCAFQSWRIGHLWNDGGVFRRCNLSCSRFNRRLYFRCGCKLCSSLCTSLQAISLCIALFRRTSRKSCSRSIAVACLFGMWDVLRGRNRCGNWCKAV